MAIQKQNVPINFSQGLDTKTDPLQVMPGKFLSLKNTIFSKGGLLQKRNGFNQLPSLPDTSNTFLTTFNGNLTAVGNTINAFSLGNNEWLNKGTIQPVELGILPLIRSNTTQTQVDTAFAPNGTVCTVFTDNVPSGSTTVAKYKYVISDATTGQNIIPPALISAQVSSAFAVIYGPRVFALGNYFMVVFGAGNHLQYIPISQSNPGMISSAADISTTYQPVSTGSFDGVVTNGNLYLSWNGAANSGTKAAYINPNLGQSNTVTIASTGASIVSVTADTTPGNAAIWTSTYIAGSNTGSIIATNTNLQTLFAAKQYISSASAQVTNLASSARNGTMNLMYESANTYSYDSSVPSNYISQLNSTNTGSLSTTSVLVRSVGLASKQFLIGSSNYFMAAYSSTYQPTYFLMNSTGGVVARLAYQNGGGYVTTGMPSVTVIGNTANVGYLFKDSIQAVNKDTNVGAGIQTAGIYSQTGINLASFNFSSDAVFSSEIGANLNLTGGMLWGYDGYVPTEQNFNVWPDSIKSGASFGLGSLTAQIYNYQVTYEWTDNQGNAFRSAPSIPISVTIGSANSSITVNVPTLRLTYKTANPVKIVIYRWSAAQQTYFQCTSITQPVLNDTTIDSVSFTDKLPDAQILGNNIIYTNGGVVENTGAPACNAMTLWQSRLWLVDAEDPNLLWYSKQVIEATPVEMSDLFTLFVAPTTGAQGSTGPITALSSMDDKLIIFKRNAIYMVNGAGPDNTGANSQFSDPTFITATVGCTNQKSIVFTPNGIMFQSDKGIWLLGRDLSTQYLGAPVEAFNQYSVQSALNIPGTNQIRFTLSNGQTLMYDYFYNQWGTFVNIPAISSALYQNVQTYINSRGQVFQEMVGSYLDGTNPVLMSFVTSWFNLAGLQGFERAYFFYLLGTYISPHKLLVQVAYDYNSAPVQSDLISPDNYNGTYGSDTLYGGSNPYGGTPTKEQWRVFLQKQKCQAFQITLNEVFDSSLGTAAGAGLTLSGLNLVVSVKGTYPRLGSGKAVG